MTEDVSILENEDPVIEVQAMPEPDKVTTLTHIIIRNNEDDELTKREMQFTSVKDMALEIRSRLEDHKQNKFGEVGIRLTIYVKRFDKTHRKIIVRDNPRQAAHTLYTDNNPIPED